MLSDAPVAKSLLLPQVPVLIVAVLIFWGAELEADAGSMCSLAASPFRGAQQRTSRVGIGAAFDCLVAQQSALYFC